MSIVTLSEALLQKLKPGRKRILRDRLLCGLCLRVGKRSNTFFIATSAAGRQVRVTLGRWPLLSVEEARRAALPLLLDCRAGRMPFLSRTPQNAPTLAATLRIYCDRKNLAAGSRTRYTSLIRTHFADFCEKSVSTIDTPPFRAHCNALAGTLSSALVELARGLIGGLTKFANATYGLNMISPFATLGAAGLLPARTQPRKRILKVDDLPEWRASVETLPELQRDYLMMLIMTGMRRTECAKICAGAVDLSNGTLTLMHTKSQNPHTLPLTPCMQSILLRRIHATGSPQIPVFAGVAVEHVAKMAIRAGSPVFTLHDLRKLFATIAEIVEISDAVKRRLLNHAPGRGDTLNRHYVELSCSDVYPHLDRIQQHIAALMSGEGRGG